MLKNKRKCQFHKDLPSHCRTCYAANPRPDALMKEQLVEMTGLSPRVIRVWFQNKRCKDKKKTIQLKMQMQQEKEGRRLGYMSLGVPLVAGSPVRHEAAGALPLEVTAYQPPWKALSDFALHADLDRAPHHSAAFHHLVNQDHIGMNRSYHTVNKARSERLPAAMEGALRLRTTRGPGPRAAPFRSLSSPS
ncbi:hypothetical protein evm_014821 [Chilo suppressalis]|nr:hypothetical protein evm_014821 [Chilo suppressalis]